MDENNQNNNEQYTNLSIQQAAQQATSQTQNYQNNQGYYQQPPQAQQYSNRIPDEYKPISAWGYVGWDLLFAIPLVGFILLIVFAAGATGNINLKKYAQSKFCALLLAVIIGVSFFLVTYFLGISVFNKYKVMY